MDAVNFLLISRHRPECQIIRACVCSYKPQSVIQQGELLFACIFPLEDRTRCRNRFDPVAREVIQLCAIKECR